MLGGAVTFQTFNKFMAMFFGLNSSRQGVPPPAFEQLRKNNAGEATYSSRIKLPPESLYNASKIDEHL